MKSMATVWLLIVIEAAVSAQTPLPKSALNALQKSSPSIVWNVDSAKIADVDCDGRPDTLMLGHMKDQVAVGIVSRVGRPPQIFQFPTGKAGRQDGFCSKPEAINVSPLICDDDDDGLLPGCKAVAGCQEFSIPDDGCDAFNFYWDATRKTIAWWRH